MDVYELGKFSKEELMLMMLKLQRLKYSAVSGLKNSSMYEIDAPQLDDFHGSVSVVEIDTNFLKSMNDRYGHDAGNQYLKTQADAMVDVLAKHFGHIKFGENGDIIVPDNAKRLKNESDEMYISRIKEIVREKGLYHIGGDEFRILLEHKKKSIIEPAAKYAERVLIEAHEIMQEISERFELLWDKIRLNIEDCSGNICDVRASFGYGIANNAEEMWIKANIKELQNIADRRCTKLKVWQKIRGVIPMPPGRESDLEKLKADDRFQGLENIKTQKELLEHMYAKEFKYFITKGNGENFFTDRNKPRPRSTARIIAEEAMKGKQ